MGMIVINGIRYREEDAARLALTGPSRVSPAETYKGEPATNPNGEPNSTEDGASAGQAQDATNANPEKPAKGSKKEDWVAFALANGKTEEDLDGLTRDQIADLFDNGK